MMYKNAIIILLVSLTILNVLDVLSTHLAVNFADGEEQNKLVADYINNNEWSIPLLFKILIVSFTWLIFTLRFDLINFMFVSALNFIYIVFVSLNVLSMFM